MSEQKPTVAACYPEVDGVDLVINAVLNSVVDFNEYAEAYGGMTHVGLIRHPNSEVLEVRIPHTPLSRFGPIFVNDTIVFSEFVLSLREGIPFHCKDCANLFVSWFIDMQLTWGRDHHEEWYRAYRLGGVYAQRLH